MMEDQTIQEIGINAQQEQMKDTEKSFVDLCMVHMNKEFKNAHNYKISVKFVAIMLFQKQKTFKITHVGKVALKRLNQLREEKKKNNQLKQNKMQY